jgi:ADP-heptose:LPS heptosyltransferase
MKVKFLIIRFSSIGDIVLTSPVLRAIKNQVNNAEVHFVTKVRYAELLVDNPHIDRLHLLDDKMTPLLKSLKKENYDYIIDLHHNFRSGQIKRHLKAKAWSCKKLNINKWLLILLKINFMPRVHVVDRYMETLRELSIHNDSPGLEYFIPEKAGYDLARLPEPFKAGYLAFALGGTYYTKRLPNNKVLEICNQIPYPVVLLGGKNEFPSGEEIAASGTGNILNLCGSLTIHESASLIEKANVVLTNDTGLMHIAAAFRKKILSFWGNTVHEFGMYPYMPDPESMRLEVTGLKCRPCSKLGYQKCPKGHFRCMNDIDTRAAIEWITKNY